MGSEHSTPFRRLGQVVYRRRKYVIVAWIVALLVVIPLITNEGKVTSLQQGAATGSQLESVKASNLVSAEFQKTVANSTLLVVVSGDNVSSVATQGLVHDIVANLKSDHSIRGLNQTLDVYSRLYAAISGINKGTFATLDGANGTAHLLLGVPALYFGAWGQAFSMTHNVTASNHAAYSFASSALSKSNVSLRMLSVFYAYWSASCNNPSTISACASSSALKADAAFIQASPAAQRSFSTSVVHSITFDEFIRDAPSSFDTRLDEFAVHYTSNLTAYSPRFVNATFLLGRTFDNSSVRALAGGVVAHPSRYDLDPGLSSLVSSLVSPGRDLTLITLGLNQSSNANLVRIRTDVQQAVANAGSTQSAAVTGGDAIQYDFGNATQADLGLILPVTIGLLIVATGLFFRSVLTPFITLGTIGVALGISQVFIVIVGTYVAKVDFTIPTILLTVLIGVGTDYSVFVIARYREQRVKGNSVEEAIETSVTWAGESIATSGATVIISFLALALTSITFLRTMGFVVGLGVLVALSVALTLVPSIISMVGGRTFWPNSGRRFERYAASVLARLETKRGYFSRSGAFSVRRAKYLIVLAILVSVPTLYIYANTTPTYDFLSAAPSNLESVSASNHLTSSFGAGTLFPTYVVLTFSQPVITGHTFNSGEMSTVDSVSSYLITVADVRNVTSTTRPFGVPVAYTSLNLSSASDERTYSAMLRSIGKDNRTVLVTVNFGIDPYSTAAIGDAQAIRQNVHSSYDSAPGVTGIYVGGASGGILDTKNVFDSQFSSVVPIVAVGVALILLIVLGSLFLPVFAVFSVLMSIVWTLAVTKLVFQQYFNYQILFITPFFLFVVLLGLGMDYNIFILTRIREEATKGKHLDDAIVGAIEQTGGIITAAAIILAGSLGALMLSSDLLLKQLGFSFAFSILIDALVVRTYLVPAVMSTAGKWNWYSPFPFFNRSKSLYERGNEPPLEA